MSRFLKPLVGVWDLDGALSLVTIERHLCGTTVFYPCTNRPLSLGGHVESQENKKLWTCSEWDQPFLVVLVGWVFSCSIGEKPFLVGLVDQLFQPAQNLVEMIENDG